MSFPVKTSDLKNISVTDDEEASYVVIEAILNSTFDEIEFSEEINRNEFKHQVTSHELFDEISNSIVDQKNLINSVVAKNKSSDNISKLLEIQHNSLTEINSEASKSAKIFSDKFKYASAACLILLFISLSSFTMFAIKKTNEARNAPQRSENTQVTKSSDSPSAGVTSDSSSLESEKNGSSTGQNYSVVSADSENSGSTGYTNLEIISLIIIAIIFVSIVIFSYFFLTKKLQDDKKQSEMSFKKASLVSESNSKFSFAFGLFIVLTMTAISATAYVRYQDRPNTEKDSTFASDTNSDGTASNKTTREPSTVKPETALSLQYNSSTSLIESIKNNKSTLIKRYKNNENAIENYSSQSTIDDISLNDLFYCENIGKTFQGYSVFPSKINDDNVYVLVGSEKTKTVAKIYTRCEVLDTINLD